MPPEPEPPSEENNLSAKKAAKLMQDALLDSEEATAPWEPPLPEDLSALMPGYSITRILGRGGMGAVYHAVQSNLEREVAIKLLPPELGQNPEFEARFKREAQSMAQLNHPNIVRIFDFGETDAGHHFISMEYVDGTDLHQLISNGKLDPGEALNVISQICDALEYAHSEGYIHRDIKPANMFVNSQGVIKVGDFGLAKLIDDESSPSVLNQMGLTMTGVAMGTPHYIAPEQLDESDVVDQRADLFSLGVMFYEMLTGEIPRGAVKVPSKKNKAIDVRIDGIVFKAMDSNPGDRYQSATDLRADVDALRNDPTPTNSDSNSPAQNMRRLTTPLVLGLIILPLLILGGTFYAVKITGVLTFPRDEIATNVSLPDSSVDNSADEIPATKKRSGFLHGLVYERTHKKVVPIWIPSGFKQRYFTSIGATESNGRTATTAFSIWAITTENSLFSTYNQRQMSGTARQPNGVLSFEDKVAVSADGTLIAHPDFFPPPVGANFIEAQWGSDFAIALASNGNVVVWKSNNHNGQLFHPPIEALRNAHSISAENQIATVLSKTGKVTQWHSRNGLISNVLTDKQDIIAVSTNVAIDKNGKVHSEIFTDLMLPGKAVGLSEGNEILALKFQSGDWKLYQKPGAQSESSTKLIAAFEAASKERVAELFVRASGEREMALVLWLEAGPATKNEEPPKAVFLPIESGTSSSNLIRSTTKKNPYENFLGMKFLPVPIVGGPTDGQNILFSIWETRVSDYRAFHETNLQREWLETDFPQDGDHPAVRMPFPDAVSFCNWLTEQERSSGKLQLNEIYRLPTDHEWSCAVGIGHLEDPYATPALKECRIPNLYYWGPDLPPPNDFGNFYGNETLSNSFMTPKGTPRTPLRDFSDPYDRTSPVGSFAPNEYGLYDMEGNAFEWCSDWYSYEKERKALRGASWGISHEHNLLTSSRIANARMIRFDSHGFRCVIAVEDPKGE